MMLDRVHRWAVLLAVGLGIFLLIVVPTFWIKAR